MARLWRLFLLAAALTGPITALNVSQQHPEPLASSSNHRGLTQRIIENPQQQQQPQHASPKESSFLMSSNSRRHFVATCWATTTASLVATLTPADAAAATAKDCLTDCVSNCHKIVPNDKTGYCVLTCQDYCAQEDRQDGLSGSVSASGGEVGILGGTFGQGTVVRGEDKPPSVALPGLNFNSKEGRQLLGYGN
mmetsp:Transcript_27974/g.76982  ORF Transcript_27974/g.76982 Transcript_27974/m.76982 type:complete len:194 (-) Transcript_27974:635-1216(-)